VKHFTVEGGPAYQVQTEDYKKPKIFVREALLEKWANANATFKAKKHTYPPNRRYLKVFIATATPGDTPEEIVKLLNLVHNPTKPPITTDTKTFEIATRGLVSYVNNDNDSVRGWVPGRGCGVPQ
jgi:hypothetical protein